jgi:hypothetical protein
MPKDNNYPTAYQFVNIAATATEQTFSLPIAFDYIQLYKGLGQVTVTIEPRSKVIPNLINPAGISLKELCPAGMIKVKDTVAETITLFVSSGGVRVENLMGLPLSGIAPAVQVGGLVLESVQIPFGMNMPVIVGMKGYYSRKAWDLQTVNEDGRGWGNDSGGTLSPQNLAAAPASGYNLLGFNAGASLFSQVTYAAKTIHIDVSGLIVGTDSFIINGNLYNGGSTETIPILNKLGTILSPVGKVINNGIISIPVDRFYQINFIGAGSTSPVVLHCKYTYN